jgi:serine phosphatase RsbU (regulator of sigma subunit)
VRGAFQPEFELSEVVVETGAARRLHFSQVFAAEVADDLDAAGMVDILVDLVEEAPVGLALLDVGGRLRLVNRHFSSALGLPTHAHLGLRPSELHAVGETFESHVREVVDTRQPVLERRMLVSDPDTGDEHQWSTSFFPINVGDRLIGVGTVVVDVTGEELARQRAEQLLRFAGMLGATNTADDVANTVVQFVSTTFRSRCVVGFVRDGALHVGAVQGFAADVRERWTNADFPLTAARPMVDAVRTGRIIQIASPSDFAEAYAALDAERQELGDASVIVIPLSAHDENGTVSGAVRVGWPHVLALGDTGWTLLRTVVSMTELALSRIAINERNEAQRVAERIADEQRRMAERQRNAVELLQRAALPVQLPRIEGLTLDAVYQPAARANGIGGDWYDVFRLGTDRVGLVIADVAGHGEDAASFMVQVRNMLRAMAMEHAEPHVVLERVNTVARSLADFDVPFITCCYAVLALRDRRLAWSKAGHFDPLVVSAAGDARYAASPIRPPLTVDDEPDYTTTRLTLEPGDRIVLFTDGLIERRGEAIDVGLARLAERAAESRQCDVSDCLESLLGIVGTQFDDLALICVDLD